MADGTCACGCGAPTTLIRKSNKTRGEVRGEYRRFVKGHATRKTDAAERSRLDRIGATIRRYQERNPQKRRAHVALNNALRLGWLARGPCEVCGAQAEAHHDDYEKPLEVRWLCRQHHKELHRLAA